MAKKKQQDEEVLVDVTEKMSRLEKWVNQNRQMVSIVAGAVVIIVGGYFAYQQFYLKPLEKEAQDEFYRAQLYFENDSLQLALKGDGQNMGALDIAAEYSATETGNLANYYAGVAYLNAGEFENAILLLDEFESDDPVLKVIATGAIGDAFMELDQPEEALGYYRKAVNSSKTDFITPFYLKKAGIAAELNNEYDDALQYYQRLKDEFPESLQASGIETYIAYARSKSNS